MTRTCDHLGYKVAMGVSGHRYLADETEIIPHIELCLNHIEQVYRSQNLTVLSPLASGADQIVARLVLNRPSGNLVVPLPRPLSEYIEDFDTTSARQAFLELLSLASEVIELPAQDTREQAYWQAGLYILDHCDLLLAIWDGGAPLGLGGTGQVVAEARQRGLPLVWIRANSNRFKTGVANHISHNVERIIYERLP